MLLTELTYNEQIIEYSRIKLNVWLKTGKFSVWNSKANVVAINFPPLISLYRQNIIIYFYSWHFLVFTVQRVFNKSVQFIHSLIFINVLAILQILSMTQFVWICLWKVWSNCSCFTCLTKLMSLIPVADMVNGTMYVCFGFHILSNSIVRRVNFSIF